MTAAYGNSNTGMIFTGDYYGVLAIWNVHDLIGIKKSELYPNVFSFSFLKMDSFGLMTRIHK